MQDFVGFTFNEVHSSEFNLKVTSNEGRYSEPLTSDISNTSITAGGMEGELFVKETIGKINFPVVTAAFDNLSEVKFRELRKWLRTTEPKSLIFDERPYKEYLAKVDKTPVISYLCFTEKEERVYKGEVSISFVSYFPYGISRFKDLISFTPGAFPNKYEWAESSGLINNAAAAGLDVFIVYPLSAGIIEGLEVTATNPASLTVNVSAGEAILPSGERVTTLGETITISPNPNGFRYDFIAISPSGEISVIEGNQDTVPNKPTLPDNYIAIAEIYMDDFDKTTVLQSDITDKRTIIDEDSLLSAVAPIMNPGDVETPFKITFTKQAGEREHTIQLYQYRGGTYNEVSDKKFVIKYGQPAATGSLAEIVNSNSGVIEIDTFKRTVVFIYTQNGLPVRLPIYFAMTEGDLFKIPVCKQNEYEMRITGFYPATPSADLPELTYNYLYY